MNKVLKNRINLILLGLFLIFGNTSIYALDNNSWESISIPGVTTSVKKMKNNQCNNNFQYGIIMLHGGESSDIAGINQIIAAASNLGNMNTMMELFKQDCALVLVPGANSGKWEYGNSFHTITSDAVNVGSIIKYMHEHENIKIFLIGGSSGGGMAYTMGLLKLAYYNQYPSYLAISGIVIADAASPFSPCLPSAFDCINKNGNTLDHTYTDEQILGFEGNNWTWNIPTLFISSINDTTLPTQTKDRTARALTAKGSGFFYERKKEGLSHQPWTEGANMAIHYEILSIVNN